MALVRRSPTAAAPSFLFLKRMMERLFIEFEFIAIWLMLPWGQAKEVLGNQTSIKRET